MSATLNLIRLVPLFIYFLFSRLASSLRCKYNASDASGAFFVLSRYMSCGVSFPSHFFKAVHLCYELFFALFLSLLPPCLSESFFLKATGAELARWTPERNFKVLFWDELLILCRSHGPTAIFYHEGGRQRINAEKRFLKKKGESLKTLERWTHEV